MQRGLTVEQKMKAMREVQEIYALAKKWRRNLPDERRPDFENMADRIMRRALELPTVAPEPRAPIYARAAMAQQDPEAAHMIERTLKTGMYDLDVLHSYQSGRTLRQHEGYPLPAPDTRGLPDPHVFVQHPAVNHIYPSHHSLGGSDGNHFVPCEHLPPSHYEPLPEPTPFAPHGVPTNAPPDTHYS